MEHQSGEPECRFSIVLRLDWEERESRRVSPEVDPQNPQETTMAKPVSAEVHEATAKLRTYHQLGLQLLKKRKSDSRRWADMQAIGEQSNLPAHQVRTLRRFAALYSDADLEQRCRQCEQHNRVIGLTAVRHLVKFDDGGKRAEFQERLIREGWSNVRIVAELKRELRPDWRGGRPPRTGEDVPGVRLQLQGFALAWRRWAERLADEDDEAVKIRFADLPDEVQAAMAKVTKAFKAISAAVSPPPPHKQQKKKKKSDGKDRAVTRKRR